jgi:hypothetical protein
MLSRLCLRFVQTLAVSKVFHDAVMNSSLRRLLDRKKYWMSVSLC